LAINGSVVTEIPPPTITMTSPQEGDSTLSIYEDEFANLRFIVQSPLPLANITIYRDSELIKLLPVDQESFVYAVNQDEKLIPGEYTFKIQAQNEKRSKSSKSIRVTILKR
jgi:hypothetical protein